MTSPNPEPAWRCFVAVPLPDGLRGALAAAVNSWRSQRDVPNMRWTDGDGWHVTLAFLGRIAPGLIAPGTIAPIGDALRDVAGRFEAFRVPSGGLGAFPSRSRARVVWYRVEDPDARLAALADTVRDALLPFVPRLADETSFRPHITLARARGERGLSLTDWLAEREAPSGSIEVKRIVVYRSHLGRGPAWYESLASLPLGVPAPVGHALREAPAHG